MICWLPGMMMPRILIDTGAPAEMNRSDACFSAISLNKGVRNMLASKSWKSRRSRDGSSRHSQQFIDTGLGARLGVYLFDDDCAVQAVFPVSRWQVAGDHDRTGRYLAVKDFAGFPVVDARALANIDAH